MGNYFSRTNFKWESGCSVCASDDKRCSTDSEGYWCNCYTRFEGAVKIKDGGLGRYGVHLLKKDAQAELNKYSSILANSSSKVDLGGKCRSELSDIEIIFYDEVYRYLLSKWTLSPRHYQYLSDARKFDDVEIARQLYKTSANNSAISNELFNKFGSGIFKVPGIRGSGQNPYFVNNDRLTFPTVNQNNRVLNLRIRSEDEDLEKSKKIPKYFYASNAKIKGAAAVPSVHVVQPIVKKSELVWITEGELKAHTISYKLGVTAISIPGVRFWPLATECLVEMKVNEVVVAFDSDLFEIKDVGICLINFVKNLKERNFCVKIAKWY